jgi:hypothetical protein
MAQPFSSFSSSRTILNEARALASICQGIANGQHMAWLVSGHSQNSSEGIEHP